MVVTVVCLSFRNIPGSFHEIPQLGPGFNQLDWMFTDGAALPSKDQFRGLVGDEGGRGRPCWGRGQLGGRCWEEIVISHSAVGRDRKQTQHSYYTGISVKVCQKGKCKYPMTF